MNVKRRTISRPHEVAAFVGLSMSRMYGLVREGLFPKPFKLGPRAIAFYDDEIDAWLEAQAAKRDAGGPTDAAAA